jgi:hypothetical protein
MMRRGGIESADAKIIAKKQSVDEIVSVAVEPADRIFHRRQ